MDVSVSLAPPFLGIKKSEQKNNSQASQRRTMAIFIKGAWLPTRHWKAHSAFSHLQIIHIGTMFITGIRLFPYEPSTSSSSFCLYASSLFDWSRVSADKYVCFLTWLPGRGRGCQAPTEWKGLGAFSGPWERSGLRFSRSGVWTEGACRWSAKIFESANILKLWAREVPGCYRVLAL